MYEKPSPEYANHVHVEALKAPRNTNMVPVSRVTGMHIRLEKAGKISPAESNWAERYAKDCEIEQGARPTRPETERVDEDRPTGWSYEDTRLLAQSRLRRSRERMTMRQREIVESACVKAHRVCDVAIVCGMRPKDNETMEEFSKRVDRYVKADVAKAIQAGAGTTEKPHNNAAQSIEFKAI